MSKPKPNIQPRKHHFLVHGSIIHTLDDQIGSVDVNGIVTNFKKEIPAYQLGRAQQMLQLQFFKRMGETQTEVRDVVIQNLVHLGFFTDEEFQQTPEGMTVKELEEAIADEPAQPNLTQIEDPAAALLN